MGKKFFKQVLCFLVVFLMIGTMSLAAGNGTAAGSKTVAKSSVSQMVTSTQGTLYDNNFETSNLDGWFFQDGWTLKKDKTNTSIIGKRGKVNADAYFLPSVSWTDYTFNCKFKLTGGMSVNFRDSFNRLPYSFTEITTPGMSYELAMDNNWFTFRKRVENESTTLVKGGCKLKKSDYSVLSIELKNNVMKVFIDGILIVNYTDREGPFLTGGVFFDLYPGASLELDNVKATGKVSKQAKQWIRTGGPFGGVGYDVRIHPKDKNIMYVTDVFCGINKSTDGGKSWQQKNSGIFIRTGSSLDAIPIFSLTIDPNNPETIWAGSKFMKGIFKSTNGAKSWTKMDNGVTESHEIVFRGFAVMPGNSNIILAAAEISGNWGINFDRSKGKIYRSTDGGKNWTPVWEGGSLARVVLFNPKDPNIVYCSTGIFDREAGNDKGEGILKSTDGGKTWSNINTGLENLFAGFLEMHPTNPDILMCAVGNVTYSKGNGIYKTIDGGKTWKKVLDGYEPKSQTGEVFAVVTFSKSNPNVVYAGSAWAFYRSDDGGATWNRYNKEAEACYGPPGGRAGIPVSAVVDPDDPMTVYVNNYAGGVIKSADGGKTWEDKSKGYTGEDSFKVTVSKTNPNVVYTTGKSGVFRSDNKGEPWEGLQYGIVSTEWQSIAMNPINEKIALLTDEFSGIIHYTNDGGNSWKNVFAKEGLRNAPDFRQGFREIEFSSSDPKIVYAGMRREKKAIDGSMKKGSSFGMYKSEDGGITWKEINHGLEKADNNINCITIHPKNPDIVYIGTYRDGAFRTIDGGKNWMAISNGLMSEDVRSIAIDINNPDTVYAGLGAGIGLYKTIDGGKRWESANQGIIVECPSYLQRIGQVNPGVSLEKPRRTLDSDYISMPWTTISSIIVDPVRKNTLYISDYHLGVYISTDSGKNWAPINAGLDVKAVTSLSMAGDGKILYASTSGGGIYRLEL